MPSQLIPHIKASEVRTVICCALACEAKSFIDFFKLKKMNQYHAFSVYQSDSVYLLVSGMGSINMAAAVNWLQGVLCEQPLQFWLNVGVAGHQSAELGSLFCASKISLRHHQSSFYPTKSQKHRIKLESIITADKEELDYPKNHLYDMEAFAFYQSCSRFNTQENIQCLKVVSDNALNPVNKDKTFIADLIAAHCELIADFIFSHIQALSVYASDSSLKGWLDNLLHDVHVSHSQSIQINKLCQSAISHDIELSHIKASTAKQVIKDIETLLHLKAVNV